MKKSIANIKVKPLWIWYSVPIPTISLLTTRSSHPHPTIHQVDQGYVD